MKTSTFVLVVLVFFLSTGCATYKTTLTNGQGQTVTCEASGKSGIITGYYLRRGFEECISAMKAQGFVEMPTNESEKPNK